ncbi:MAG: nitronate monooxygenase [Myxococcales bacterium]
MERQRKLCDLLGIELPIVQAPMAGAQDPQLAVAVASAGGLASLPCAMLSPEQIRTQVRAFRACAERSLNLNFFCHSAPSPDPARDQAWRTRLAPYYAELHAPEATLPAPLRAPFDATLCEVVEELRPSAVSFHFGLPSPALLERVRATGAVVLSSATTVAEARALEDQGCDVIIAQGAEAGGHRGMFLTDRVASQVGTLALVPQVVDAVKVPVLAAGGIADARGVLAAIALGASGVQVGTAYLKCRESTVSALHRAALAAAQDDSTQLTNVFTGRPARSLVNRLVREVGPLSADAPEFPGAASALAPLRALAEAQGASDFSPLWSGQAAALARAESASELTRALWSDALDLLGKLKS